jgi:hypothetical protein
MVDDADDDAAASRLKLATDQTSAPIRAGARDTQRMSPVLMCDGHERMLESPAS